MKIGVIGSCRVLDPLRAAGAEVQLNPSIGYIHNPLEVLQAFDLVQGRLIPPDDLVDVMNIRRVERIRTPFDVDCYVVELSSIRIVQHDTWQLQVHRLRELLVSEGLSEDDLKKLYGRLEVWRSAVGDLASRLPPRSAHLILNTKFFELSKDEIISALDQLATKLDRPALIVGPIVEGMGAKPPQRVLLREAINEWVRPANVRIFDPTPLLQEGDLKDLGHYAPHAISKIGHAILEAAKQCIDPVPAS